MKRRDIMALLIKEQIVQRLLSLTLLVALALLCFQVVKFFIVPALWAAIIAYVTWPLYLFFHQKIRLSPSISALIMTMAIVLLIGIPTGIAVVMLQQEALSLYGTVLHRLKSGYLDLPSSIKNLPVIGQQIKDILWELNKDPDATMTSIKNWIQSHLSYGKQIMDVATKSLAKLGMAMMTLFFFYRDGISLVRQIRLALRNIIGNRIDGYIDSVGETTQAVVYGIGLTALAQALLAGLGYWVANAPNPILLTILTFIVALIPFGTPFAWGGVALWLFTQGHFAESVGLALWGGLVVSWVDNLIRPMVISGATQIPFIIIFIGVLGGLTAFGFVGMFIGPVVLAIGLAVWREWISHHRYVLQGDIEVKMLANQSTKAENIKQIDAEK